MRIDHRGVKWGNEEVEVCEQNGHGTVNDAIITVYEALWLVCVASRVGRGCEGRVCKIELLAPSNELGSPRGGRSNVGIVGTDSLALGIPL